MNQFIIKQLGWYLFEFVLMVIYLKDECCYVFANQMEF